MLNYIIVYPRGDRSRLTVALARDYEIKSDYALASRQIFDDSDEGKKEATKYMIKLAEDHGLSHDAPGHHDFLD